MSFAIHQVNMISEREGCNFAAHFIKDDDWFCLCLFRRRIEVSGFSVLDSNAAGGERDIPFDFRSARGFENT